jgi:hypothetical protein
LRRKSALRESAGMPEKQAVTKVLLYNSRRMSISKIAGLKVTQNEQFQNKGEGVGRGRKSQIGPPGTRPTLEPTEQPRIGVVERQKDVLRAKVMGIGSFRALTKSTPLLPPRKVAPPSRRHAE